MHSQIKKILKNTVKEGKWLTLGMGMAIAGSVICGLIPPLILEKIVNRLTAGAQVGIQLAIGYFLLVVISGVFDGVKEVAITIFGQKITRGLRKGMCQKLCRLPAAYFTGNETGKITSRFVNDVDTVESLFDNGIISMIADSCKVISILIVIWVKSRGLGILMLLVTPALFWVTRAFQRRMLKAQVTNRKAISKVNNHVPETIQNIRMIRNFYKQRYMEEKYDEYIGESYDAVEKSNFYDSVYSPIIIFTSSCIIAIVMILSSMGGGYRAFFGMSVGTAVAVIAYVGKIFGPLESIGMEIQNIQSAVAGVSRINEFLEEQERQMPTKKVEEIETIQLQHVTFGYDPGRPVLKDFGTVIQKGEHVTLIGRTGAGKSTIFKLLLGLYHPQEGQVEGKWGTSLVSLDQIEDEEKRKLFGYVEQSFHLVPGRVIDQITLFDPDITRNSAIEAAKLVGLDEMIRLLPQDYDTLFNQRDFSQGQLQLLSIARAIVGNPQIMLLDEMTANLDAQTEQEVMEAITQASKNRTVISISHRLAQNLGSRFIQIG